MGLFDNLRGQQEIALTPRSAMLLACISMVAADGAIDDDEISVIQRIDGRADTQDWDKAIKAWRAADGPVNCIELVTPHLNKDQKKFTMANLVDIAMADGVLAGSEKDLLEGYFRSFGLDEDFIISLVDVVSIKNDISPFE